MLYNDNNEFAKNKLTPSIEAAKKMLNSAEVVYTEIYKAIEDHSKSKFKVRSGNQT